MTLDELKRLHEAVQLALAGGDSDEYMRAYYPAADAAFRALPALIECAERLDALVAEFSMAMLADQPFTVEELQQSRDEWERARAALARLNEVKP